MNEAVSEPFDRGAQHVSPHRFLFDSFALDVQRRSLTQGDREIELGARAFDLLVYLATHQGRIVSRTELIQHVWPNVVVGDNNLNVQISTVRKALGKKSVLTLPGRGVQFGFELVDHTPAKQPIVKAPEKPSVVVLPFDFWGSSSEHEWLPDWIAEDISTALSRFNSLLIVSHNSAAQYSSKYPNFSRIAKELDVRYALTGSVKIVHNRFRVAVRLIDTITSAQIWAENYDSQLSAHDDMHSQIAHAIVGAIAPQIDGAENTRALRGPPRDICAIGHAQRAWAAIAKCEMDSDPAPGVEAIQLVDAALRHEPDCLLAWRARARILWWRSYHAKPQDRADILRQGIQAAERAISIDHQDHHAWRLRALMEFMAGNPNDGLPGIRHAHKINPNCATTLCWLGYYEVTHGDSSVGLLYAKAALRLSPRDPARAVLLAMQAFTQFAAGEYVDSSVSADASIREWPGSPVPLIAGTIAHVGAGQYDRARHLFTDFKRIAPGIAEARLLGVWLATNESYTTRAQVCLQYAAGQVDEAAMHAVMQSAAENILD